MLKKGKLEPLVPIPTISMVQAVCRLLEGLLPALHDKTSEVSEAVGYEISDPQRAWQSARVTIHIRSISPLRAVFLFR